MKVTITASKKPDRFEDVGFMSSPGSWPRFVLPLKHRTERDPCGFPKLGVLLPQMGPQGQCVVMLGNMLSLKADAPRVHYASVEAVAEDWIVD